MEWLANALIGVRKVYLNVEISGTSRKLIPVNGTVIRFYDGQLYIGGLLENTPQKIVDVELICSDGARIRLVGLEIDIIEDRDDTYFNGQSKNGSTKVLYVSKDDAEVRIELGGTL